MTKTFKPLCTANKTEIAVNNRNQLIPCCHLDTPGYLEDSTIKKLTDSSDISKYKSLDDIINSKEWVELYRVIHEASDTQDTKNVPWPCVEVCTKKESEHRTADWLIGEGGQ